MKEKGALWNLSHTSCRRNRTLHLQNHDVAAGAISPPQHRLISGFIANSRHLLHCTFSYFDLPTAAFQSAIEIQDAETESQRSGNCSSKSTTTGSDGGERETRTGGSSRGASADLRWLRRDYRFANFISVIESGILDFEVRCEIEGRKRFRSGGIGRIGRTICEN